MDVLQQGVLALIHAAITAEPAALPEGFSLASALDPIRRHQIAGLAYEGAVVCGIDPKEEAMQKLRRAYYANMLRSEKQLQALSKIFDAFQSNGIDHLPLKGCVLKALYPQPGMRPMGDADVLIRMEQYDRVRPIMQGLGFAEKISNGYELVWTSPELYLELHKTLMPSKSSDFFRYFENAWQRATAETGSRYRLSPEDNFVFLFVHYAKHYRGGGIGLRQLTDLWVYQRANPNLDMGYVRKEMAALKLEKFFDNTEDMLKNWFENGLETDVTAFMSSFIWKSGSWGDRKSHAVWDGIVSEKNAGSRLGGKIRDVIKALFPPAKILRIRYPIVGKAPWLTPVFWPVRWVSALLFRRKNVRNFHKDMQAQTDENMGAYQQALAYVGLDCDF